MRYLYLDESGDLGFDFFNKNPSKFFTVSVLALGSTKENRRLIKAVKVTLRRKLNPPKHRRRMIQELKGEKTTIEVKKYFLRQVTSIKFGIYSMTLNKKRVYDRLTKEKARVYNFIARQVLDHIPFERNRSQRVELIIDRSKSKPEIAEFNFYIRRQLEGRLNPSVPLDIYHHNSQESSGLQAIDMFCWGIWEKYERKSTEWFNLFSEKVMFEKQYL